MMLIARADTAHADVNGDATANDALDLTFADIATRYQTEIFQFLVRLTSCNADADALYRETLLRASRAFGQGGGEPSHRFWLFGIAADAVLAHHRRLDRGRCRPANRDTGDLLRDLRAVIGLLPVEERIALVLRKYHRFDYGEIAGMLGMSEAATRKAVYQTLRRLRDHVAGFPAVQGVAA